MISASAHVPWIDILFRYLSHEFSVLLPINLSGLSLINWTPAVRIRMWWLLLPYNWCDTDLKKQSPAPTTSLIIHQIHYEKSEWSRAFNQFTIACELDMINAISAADIAFIMSSSMSARLLSLLERSQKQNGWTLRFCFWGWIIWKMYNKTIIKFGFRMIKWIINTSCLCYLPQPSASVDNTDLGFDNSWYHAQPHPIIVHWL